MPNELLHLIEELKETNVNNAWFEGYAERSNILIQNKADYIQSRSELSVHYDLVELEAFDLVFYKITSYEGGLCRINHGPGTEQKTIHESELDFYLNIERPVLFYHLGNINCEFNQHLYNLLQNERVLLVINNIDKIDNDTNRRVLINFIRTSRSLPPAPVIAITSDDIDSRLLYTIRVGDGKDSFWNYPSIKLIQ